jgi:peroxiredoxin
MIRCRSIVSCLITTCNRPRVALLVAGLVAAVSVSCAGPQTGGSGDSGRDFTLSTTDGRTARLSDHLGEVVLINFWATWCVPCAAELPHLQRLYETYSDQGFVVLAISMDGPESAANVNPQVRRYGLTFPVLLDEETRVVGVYNPKRTAPFSVLIGPDGNIVKTRAGYSAGDEVALEADIRELLATQKQAP